MNIENGWILVAGVVCIAYVPMNPLLACATLDTAFLAALGAHTAWIRRCHFPLGIRRVLQKADSAPNADEKTNLMLSYRLRTYKNCPLRYPELARCCLRRIVTRNGVSSSSRPRTRRQGIGLASIDIVPWLADVNGVGGACEPYDGMNHCATCPLL